MPWLISPISGGGAGLGISDSWLVSGSQACPPPQHLFTLLWRAVLYVPLAEQAENQI